MIGIVLPVSFAAYPEILAGDTAQESRVACSFVAALPFLNEGVVSLAPRRPGGKVAHEVDPILANGILQRPGSQVGPAISDQVGVVAILNAGLLDLHLELPLLLGIEDIDETKTTVSAIG